MTSNTLEKRPWTSCQNCERSSLDSNKKVFCNYPCLIKEFAENNITYWNYSFIYCKHLIFDDDNNIIEFSSDCHCDVDFLYLLKELATISFNDYLYEVNKLISISNTNYHLNKLTENNDEEEYDLNLKFISQNLSEITNKSIKVDNISNEINLGKSNKLSFKYYRLFKSYKIPVKSVSKKLNKFDIFKLKSFDAFYDLIKNLFDKKNKGKVEAYITLTFNKKKKGIKTNLPSTWAEFSDPKVSHGLVKNFIKEVNSEQFIAFREHHKDRNPHFHIFIVIEPCGIYCKIADKGDRKKKICQDCIDKYTEVWGAGKVDVRNIKDRKEFIKEYGDKELEEPKDYSKKVIVPKSIKSKYLSKIRYLKRKIYGNKKEEFDIGDVDNQASVVDSSKQKEISKQWFQKNKERAEIRRNLNNQLKALKILNLDLIDLKDNYIITKREEKRNKLLEKIRENREKIKFNYA